jgi:hypothetical protein
MNEKTKRWYEAELRDAKKKYLEQNTYDVNIRLRSIRDKEECVKDLYNIAKIIYTFLIMIALITLILVVKNIFTN